MDEKQKNMQNEQTSTNTINDGILRPSMPSEEILKNKQTLKQNQLTSRIEQYNHNQGFKPVPVKKTNNINNEPQQTPNKITIKAPKKKNKNILIITLLILIILGCGGYFYYQEIYLKNLNTPAPKKEEPAPPQEEILEEAKNKIHTCSLNTSRADFGYASNIKYQFYTTENRLKKYTKLETITYLENKPSEKAYCDNYTLRYNTYDGYSSICNMIDEKNFEFLTTVDLNILNEKKLTFSGSFVETIVIEENLNDNINIYLTKYKDLGYTCTEEVDESVNTDEPNNNDESTNQEETTDEES